MAGDPANFARNLRRLIEWSDKSVQEVAQEADMPVQKLSRWVTKGLKQVDRKSRHQLRAVCEAVDMMELRALDNFAMLWLEKPPWELDMDVARRFCLTGFKAIHAVPRLLDKLHPELGDILRRRGSSDLIHQMLREEHFVVENAVQRLIDIARKLQIEQVIEETCEYVKLHNPTVWEWLEQTFDDPREIIESCRYAAQLQSGSSPPPPEAFLPLLVERHKAAMVLAQSQLTQEQCRLLESRYADTAERLSLAALRQFDGDIGQAVATMITLANELSAEAQSRDGAPPVEEVSHDDLDDDEDYEDEEILEEADLAELLDDEPEKETPVQAVISRLSQDLCRFLVAKANYTIEECAELALHEKRGWIDGAVAQMADWAEKYGYVDQSNKSNSGRIQHSSDDEACPDMDIDSLATQLLDRLQKEHPTGHQFLLKDPDVEGDLRAWLVVKLKQSVPDDPYQRLERIVLRHEQEAMKKARATVEKLKREHPGAYEALVDDVGDVVPWLVEKLSKKPPDFDPYEKLLGIAKRLESEEDS